MENRQAVAVLDFESVGTEEYLGKAVSEIIRTALISNPNYRIVERAQINQAISEQKFQKSGMIDDKSAVEIGKVLGANFIIVGSVVKIGDAYTINSRLIDVRTGEAKLGKNVTGNNLNLLTAMSHELVENLMGRPAVQQIMPARAKSSKEGRQYLGCFRDQGDPYGTRGRDIDGTISSSPAMTTELCLSLCLSGGFSYAGTQYASSCFCGHSYGRFGAADNCNMPCSGNQNEICGGTWSNSVYKLK